MEWKIIARAVAVLMIIVAHKQIISLLKKLVLPLKYWGKYRLNLTSVSTLLLAASVVATLLLGIIAYWRTKEENIWNAILYGINMVCQLLEGDSAMLRTAYPNHSLITFILATAVPLLTVTTVVAFLLNFFPVPLPRRSEYFIFSQVDERGVLLAESLYRKHGPKNACVIFLRSSKDELQPEYINRLNAIHARIYPYIESELLEIHFRLKEKKLRFFFISSKTDENFSRMKVLLDDASEKTLFRNPFGVSDTSIKQDECKSVFRQELYLLSETDSASMLVDHLRLQMCEERKTKSEKLVRKPVFAHTDLRLLDRYRTVTYHLLNEKPLYETAHNGTIRVLVLGFGRVGQEFFRAAASFCSMVGFKTTFCLCDQVVDKQWKHLILQYPECDRNLCVSKNTLDAESDDLLKLLNKKIRRGVPFTYIVISLGDDERNIKVASKLKRYFCRKFWENEEIHQPTICVSLEDKIKSKYVPNFFQREDAMHPTENYGLMPPLYVFGSDYETFSEKMLIKRSLWTAARRLHAKLKSEDFTYWKEYERRSSVACAAHASYHIAAMNVIAPNKDYDDAYNGLQTAQKEAFVDAEHRRWMQYSRCEGMQVVSEDTAIRYKKQIESHVDAVAKLTPCLIKSEYLDQLYIALYPETDEKKESGHTVRHPFIERDTLVVRNAGTLCRIINQESSTIDLFDYEADDLQLKASAEHK